MNHVDMLKTSFLWDKQCNRLFFIEGLFWLGVAFVSVVWFLSMNALSTPVLAPGAVQTAAATGELNAVVGALVSFFTIFFLGTALLLVLFLIGWTISRGHVWTRLLEKEFTLKSGIRFFGLKLVWTVIWLPLLVLLLAPVFLLSNATTVSPGLGSAFTFFVVLNVILWMIIAYFGLFLYTSFFEHHRIYKAITDSFRNGAKKSKHMFLPLFLVFCTWLLWWLLIQGLQLLGVDRMLGSIAIPFWIPVVLVSLYLFTATRRYLIINVM